MSTPLIPTQFSPIDYGRPRRRGVPLVAVVVAPLVASTLLLGGVAFVEHGEVGRQTTAAQTARVDSDRLAENLTSTQDKLTATQKDLAASNAKVSALTSKAARLSSSRTALIQCLGGWLKAFTARNSEDWATTAYEVNGVRSVCRVAMTPIDGEDYGTQDLSQADGSI